MTCPDHEPAPPTVAVEIRPGAPRTFARVSGAFDMENAAEVRAELIAAFDASGTGLDLDLSALTFCDSSGLNILLNLRQHAAANDKTLVLEAVSPQLARLFDLTETGHLFTIRRTPMADPAWPTA
ncbi:STAS domain-containing protein [Streptomyces sp. NPDC056387]|uniref:STAS domain-containing protein n=1 Tax=Streptomyces sp. NPDC056387 TaxID=3345803 RepID=UPI0035DEF1DF